MSVIIDCHKRCCITKDCIWFFMAGVYFRPTPALASPTRTLSPFSIRLCLLKEPIREWRKGEMVGEKNFRIIYSSTWNCSYSQNRLCSILYSSEKYSIVRYLTHMKKGIFTSCPFMIHINLAGGRDGSEEQFKLTHWPRLNSDGTLVIYGGPLGTTDLNRNIHVNFWLLFGLFTNYYV